MDIGNSIQIYRKRLGLSQEELGQQLSVSRQTVSQWENGQTVPTIDNLLRLKEIFGISLDALCGCDTPEVENCKDLPLQEYHFAPTREDIKEMCQLTCRPNLHRYLLLTAACIAGIIASTFVAEGVSTAFWVPFLLICIVGFTLRFLIDRKKLRKPLQSNASYEHAYQFFEDHFICLFFRNSVQVSWDRFQYKEIKKYYHTKNFVILHAGNQLYPIPKDVFYNVAPLQRYQDMNPRKRTLGPNVVIWRTVSLILFLASIGSIAGIALGVALLNSYNHLEVRNFWVCFLFVPIPISSIIFGIISIRKGYPCKKNIVIGIIMTVVLCLYGCFTFIFANMHTDDPVGLEHAEHYLQIDFPEYDHIATDLMTPSKDPTSPTYVGYISDIYFDADTVQDLVGMLREDERFIIGIPSELQGLTSKYIPTSTGSNDYVLFYNVETGQCNEYPVQSGIYRIIMVVFSSEQKCMQISEYNINYMAN